MKNRSCLCHVDWFALVSQLNNKVVDVTEYVLVLYQAPATGPYQLLCTATIPVSVVQIADRHLWIL